jgi:hypothetical protein
MSRRTTAYAAGAAILAAAAGPLAFHASAAVKYPTAGCFTQSDPTGDASFDAVTPNDADLDITGLALDATKKTLYAFVKIDKLAAGPMATDGARYTFDFGFNGHVFSASGSTYQFGSGAIRDGLAQTGQAGGTTQLGVDVPSLTQVPPATSKGFVTSGLKVTFDTKRGYVVFALPNKDITKYGGKTYTPVGTKLIGVDAKSGTDEYAVSSIWDTTNPSNGVTSATSWTTGANACF